MAKLKYLVIHCTDTPEHMNVTPEMIKSWHTDKKPIGRGWSRVGYSDLIMLDGTIKNLRPYDEDDKVEDFEVTNGARGYNGVSRHIAYSGGRDANSQKPKNTLNEAQLESLAEYVKEFIQNHPDAKVIGHNQINDYKKCPSFSVAFVFVITLGFPKDSFMLSDSEEEMYQKDKAPKKEAPEGLNPAIGQGVVTRDETSPDQNPIGPKTEEQWFKNGPKDSYGKFHMPFKFGKRQI
jgi:hypothetical protein